LDSTKRYIGTIKAFNASSGYGFILNKELGSLFGCDIFLNQTVEGGIVIGAAVSFTLEVSAAGKPQARNILLEVLLGGACGTLAESGAGLQGEFDKMHRGRVKSFNAAQGYGFLTCPELSELCGGHDIFVSKAQVPGERLTPGQEVMFILQVDRRGQPQARDVATSEPEGFAADKAALAPAGGLKLCG